MGCNAFVSMGLSEESDKNQRRAGKSETESVDGPGMYGRKNKSNYG